MTDAAVPPVPNIADELERKTAELLVQLQDDLVKRRVSPSYALGALRAAWAITSGLADRAVMDAIAELTTPIDGALKKAPPVDQLAVMLDAGLRPTVIVRRGLSVLISANGCPTQNVKVDENAEILPSKKAAENFATLVERHVKAGYTQLAI